MALFGASTAIASIGVSCQTAFQIRAHADLLSSLIGEPLTEHATPFDWLLCSATDTGAMIREGETYPRDVSELDGCRRPYWPRYHCWFWHRVFDDPNQFLGQARYEAKRWSEIRACERKIFFVSNTQNNLRRHKTAKNLDRALGGFELLSLQSALLDAFGQGVVVHAVSYDPEPLNCPVHWHQIAKDGTQWCGCNSRWNKIFRNVFRKG